MTGGEAFIIFKFVVGFGLPIGIGVRELVLHERWKQEQAKAAEATAGADGTAAERLAVEEPLRKAA